MIKKLLQRLTTPFSRSTQVVACHLTENDGDYVYAPKSMDDIDKYDRTNEAAEVFNSTLKKAERLKQHLRALDQTESDLNPIKGEIAVESSPFEGQSVKATLVGNVRKFGLTAEFSGGDEDGLSTLSNSVNTYGFNRTQRVKFELGDTEYIGVDDLQDDKMNLHVYR